MKKNKSGYLKKFFAVFLLIIIVLINPFPVIVSASSDFVSSLNLPNVVSRPVTTAQVTVDVGQLKKYLSVEMAFLGISDNASLNYKDLNSNQEISISPDKSWIPASVIKSYVAAEAFHQKEEGLIDFNTQVTIVADNVVPNGLETDDFPRLREGTTATISQLVGAMIIQSDNTAYNTLLDILDRRNVMAYITSLGIKNTIVGEKLNVDDNQQRKDSTSPGYQYNVTTSEDFKKLFDLVYSGKIPGSNDLLSIFKRQKSVDMIPALLPPDVQVAHKNGEWAPIYHDGGIIYKPGAPFILSLFTNSNNPSDLAKLAQVAYFGDADHVDTTLSKAQSSAKKTSSINSIYLSEIPKLTNVLGASTQNSPLTAGDLGITSNDLQATPVDQKNIPYTLITPASPLYGLKTFIENYRYAHATDSEKADLSLSFAKERLSEMKSVSSAYNQNYTQKINANFQNNLKNAATIAEKSSHKDELLLESKQLSDLHFMVLGSSSSKVSSSEKEKFINDSYQTLVKNDKEITPIVKNSSLAQATKVEPVVGVIQSIDNNIAKVTLDNGKTADIAIDKSTRVRGFNDVKSSASSALTLGDKIAVVGKRGQDGKITPTFVMKNIPKTIPKTQGVVLEIQPQTNIIKIENSTGNVQDIKVDDATTIQSKDTSVSIEGIKAGSVITVTGSVEKTSPTPTPVTIDPKATQTPVIIDAKRVVINVNGSGKNEVVVKKKNTEPNKPKTPAPAPALETKKEDKKTAVPHQTPNLK